MKFSAIIGSEAVKKQLSTLVLQRKLPHALLIQAREGGGGLPMAIALARFLFCEDRTAADACGDCAACKKVHKLAHPDLHLSFPTIPPKPGAKASSKAFLPEFREFFSQQPYGSTFDWLQFIQAENKQGNITAEECREIIDQLNMTAFEGGYKVQIIWRPEYLGNTGNMLLKLIEEPPANTVIILVAEQTQHVLNTILSRTQQITLPPLAVAEITEGLIRSGAGEQQALQAARLANNSYGEALKHLQYTENDWFPLLRQWCNGLFTGNGALIGAFLNEIAAQGREQQKHFLRYAQQIFGFALRLQHVAADTLPLPGEEQAFVQKLAARRLSFSVFRRIDAAIARAQYHIERNAHGKIQFFSLSLRLEGIIQNGQENGRLPGN